ncbi:MAG: hypothetical protein U0T82_07680 [Bacteroidales bacterium]
MKTDRQKETGNDLVFSYMTLRNLIGFCGMLLPVILLWTTRHAPGDLRVEPSISDYYYTSNGDVLVVILSVLGVFLFTYKGYHAKENLLSTLAAVCALGVAFSPTATKYVRESFSVHTGKFVVPEIAGLEVHLLFAATFFVSLAIIALVYFPKSDADSNLQTGAKRSQKDKRNLVYMISGWIMLGSVGILGLYFIITPLKEWIGDFPFIFVMETIAIEAFGISWITKGESLWPDGEHYLISFLKEPKKYFFH